LWLAGYQCRHEWQIRAAGATEGVQSLTHMSAQRQKDEATAAFFIRSVGAYIAKQFS